MFLIFDSDKYAIPHTPDENITDASFGMSFCAEEYAPDITENFFS